MDDTPVIPDLSRSAVVTDAPAPQPVVVVPPVAPAPAPAPVIHIPVYQQPIPFTGPPPAVYVSPTAMSQGPQVPPTLGDPTISSTINYSPHLETNYSQNASYYLKQGQGGGDPADWYQYPTVTGQIIFDVSGGSSQTILEGGAADLTYAGSSLLPANWYQYPTLTGEVEFIDASGSHLLKSIQGDLFFDGELLAKAGDIQDIAAWADYPAIANIDAAFKDIVDVSNCYVANLVSTENVDATNVGCSLLSAATVEAIIETNTATLNVGPLALGAQTIETTIAGGNIETTGDISGATLHISGTATIHDIDLSGCALTSDATGSALFVNGVQVQTGTPADVSQWATFPAVTNVDVSGYSFNMTGSLVPPATNKFGLGTALAPIGINDQYAFNTNIYNIAPTGTMNISSNSSMALLCTSSTGTNEFNITLAGAAGEDMNLTAPDINATMTDLTSFMNFTAPFGVNIAGGGLFMESGAIECLVGLDIRLITPGNIAIGSGNVGGATTQIEKFEYTDNVVEPMNGVYNLKLKNIEVINEPKDAGGAGYFPGVFNVQSSIANTFTVNSVATSSQKTRWSVQADQGSSRYAAMNLEAVTGGVINYNMIAGGITMNMLWDATTLTINRPLSVTGSITGSSGNFGPLYTSDTLIHLGASAATTGQGAYSIAIGASAATANLGTDAIAIGTRAGTDTTAPTVGPGPNSVSIGVDAGKLADLNSVSIGNYAGYNAGDSNISIGQNSGFMTTPVSTINAIDIGANAPPYPVDGTSNGSYHIYIGSIAEPFTAPAFGPGANSITLNATGAPLLSPPSAGEFYVSPIAPLSGSAGFALLGHRPDVGLVRRGTATLTEVESTVTNTQQISYDTGLLTTTINGITSLQTVKADGPVTIGTPAALSTLTVAGTIALQDASGNTATQVVAQPQYVYYVAKNGRVGATGAITDPLSTINAALAKAANTGAVDAPGMTIYVGVGSYTEDVVINIADILPNKLPSVSIIGMGDDTDDSKRVQIRGAMTINGTDATLVNTVNMVVLNNLSVFAKDAVSSAITMTGRGYRVYLKNGLYTTPFTASAPLISLASTGPTASSVVQLVIDNASMSMAGGAGHIISMTSGQLFEVQNTDMSHRGTGLCINMSGGAFSVANQSAFSTTGAVLNIVQSAAGLTNVTSCVVSGRASPTVALITLGTNANINLSESTVQNLNTTEANNTSRYVYTTSATGNFIAAIRNNITNSASPATVQQITPWQAAVPAASQLLYFGNIYSNLSATLVGVLPAQGGANWNAVRQFNTDTYTQQLQVVATSGTAIALTPTARGKTFILTGTTTQAFSTAGFGLADAGFYVIVHNGNATGGGDINMTGMTGTAIIHNRTATANGGDVYLVWTGAGLVGY